MGGPANASCLNNDQQPGEGWSDWFALVYTATVTDLSTDPRGIGSYLFDLPAGGGTVRDLPYSTDAGVNNWTYESIQGASIPHGVGSRWAQVLWEVYWMLVDKWGFEADLPNFDPHNPLEAGNKRALFYVNEGLKSTACSPTFVDSRNAIVQAARTNFGAADMCDMWQVFADFGLGVNAVSGGPNSTSPTNGFNLPFACQCSPQPIIEAGPDQVICKGTPTLVGNPALPDTTYSWSPGGETTAQITPTPYATTTYTVTATTSCGSNQDSLTVWVDDGNGMDFLEDFEGDTSGWTTSGLWHKTADSACASPGYWSPINAFYFGQEVGCNYETGSAASGFLTSPSFGGLSPDATLSFQYYRDVESFDGDLDRTTVEVVAPSGTVTVFALNSATPSSSSWVNGGDISLREYTGETIQLRFGFDSIDGASNDFIGWFIDNVTVTNGDSFCSPVNAPPTVSITAPADGSSAIGGDPVTFTGTATDLEDGSLTAALVWTSSLDGVIGTGGSFALSSLSVGVHEVTATVTDSGGETGFDMITLEVIQAVEVVFSSIAAEDGWARESTENSDVGGSSVASGGGFRPLRVGDANQDRQYKVLVSFDTSTIPAGATVIGATLELRRSNVSGTDPFTIFGSLRADIRSGGFGGNPALEDSDFEAPATATAVATLSAAAADGDLSTGALDAAGLAAINLTGVTQLRLAFDIDDNDDDGNDYISYFSGESSVPANVPHLVVTYFMP